MTPTPGAPVIWIISTGTEILQGLYPDTNAQWLSGELQAMGFAVRRHLALADDNESLREALAEACRSCDLAIMTGGLGPTADDLNRQSVADVYGVALREDERALREITEKFTSRGRPMPPSNRVQALVPEGAAILYNQWGTAPGFFLPPSAGSDARAALLALPGPPRENQPMFKTIAAPLLLDRFGTGRRTLRTLTLHTVGLPESTINERLGDLFGSDERVNLALLAGKWKVDIRLTLQGADETENKALEERWIDTLAERIGWDNLYGKDDTTLEQALGRLLKERNETLALAESCTGGLIAKTITDVPGSSEYFKEGFVTYSNEAKIARLKVPAGLIAEHGAVSAEVAGAMAEGARGVSGASWALSVTGVAGPGGGTQDKPVGLVFFGLASPDGSVRTRRFQGFAGRTAVRELSAITGIDMLRRAILRIS